MPRIDRPNAQAPWTDQEFERLAELIRGGKSIPEIAVTLGRSQEAVRNRARLRGLLQPRKKAGK